jgi:hypothetical protein
MTAEHRSSLPQTTVGPDSMAALNQDGASAFHQCAVGASHLGAP